MLQQLWGRFRRFERELYPTLPRVYGYRRWIPQTHSLLQVVTGSRIPAVTCRMRAFRQCSLERSATSLRTFGTQSCQCMAAIPSRVVRTQTRAGQKVPRRMAIFSASSKECCGGKSARCYDQSPQQSADGSGSGPGSGCTVCNQNWDVLTLANAGSSEANGDYAYDGTSGEWHQQPPMGCVIKGCFPCDCPNAGCAKWLLYCNGVLMYSQHTDGEVDVPPNGKWEWSDNHTDWVNGPTGADPPPTTTVHLAFASPAHLF